MDINQVSLSALIIALGMLVDNAIVMSESIMVQMSRGVPARKAALDSAAELRIPLLTSSLTTSAAFLPIYLAKSMTGEYTRPLFEVVTITLLCSWVMALTLVPALCVMFLKVKQRPAGADLFDNRFYQFYRRALTVALQRPWFVLLGVAIVFVAALQLTRFIPTLFFPQNDRPTFTIDLELPVGSPISRTEEVSAALAEYLRDEWQIDAIYSGTQKCLGCPPGLSPVSFSADAFSVMEKRQHAIQSWYLDVHLLKKYWGKERFYHHTAPISMVYALRELFCPSQVSFQSPGCRFGSHGFKDGGCRRIPSSRTKFSLYSARH